MKENESKSRMSALLSCARKLCDLAGDTEYKSLMQNLEMIEATTHTCFLCRGKRASSVGLTAIPGHDDGTASVAVFGICETCMNQPDLDKVLDAAIAAQSDKAVHVNIKDGEVVRHEPNKPRADIRQNAPAPTTVQ